MSFGLILRKLLSLVLLAVFSINTALGSWAEAHIWGERRKNQIQPFASSLNSIAANSPLKVNLSSNIGSQSKTLKTSNPVNKLIESIPLNAGTVQNFFDSGHYQVSPVVLVQDVHLNAEAQTNIAAVLQKLIDENEVGVVGVEAAFEKFDFAEFRLNPNHAVVRGVAAEFLKKTDLAAPSYVGVTSSIEPPPFVGIDDAEHYQANVDALLSSFKLKKSVLKQIEMDKATTLAQSKDIFSPELSSFDSLKRSYQNGSLNLGAYVEKLAAYNIPKEFIVDQFLEAYKMESTLDFNRVDKERKIVFEKLAKRISQTALNDLLNRSLQYRAGGLGFGDYYRHVKVLCESNGISLRTVPEFDKYVQYVLMSDGINVEKLFNAVSQLEENVFVSLHPNAEQKKLAKHSERLSLMEKLTEFSMTPLEWEKYKKTAHPSLTSFEQFYIQADIRSEKMVENLLKNHGEKPKALVVGGFHTARMTELLRSQKISYVVVSPKITKIDNDSGTSYLSAFAHQKSPLDKLFSGEKLFLGLSNRNLPDPKCRQPFEFAVETRTHSSRFPNWLRGAVRSLSLTRDSIFAMRLARSKEKILTAPSTIIGSLLLALIESSSRHPLNIHGTLSWFSHAPGIYVLMALSLIAFFTLAVFSLNVTPSDQVSEQISPDKESKLNAYLNQFLNRPLDAVIDRNTWREIKQQFDQLPNNDRKIRFTSSILQILYEDDVRFNAEDELVSDEAKNNPLQIISIEGTTILDLNINLGLDGNRLSFKSAPIRTGSTGPNAADALLGFKEKVGFYGFVGGFAGRAFQALMRNKSDSEIHYLDGRSRVSLYINLPADDKSPSEQISFRPSNPEISYGKELELITYVSHALPPAKGKSFVILGGQVFPDFEELQNNNLYKILTEKLHAKGYKTIADMKPYLTVAEMRHILAAEPTVVKTNLEEFSRLANIDASVLKANPDLVMDKAQQLAEQYNIRQFIVSLEEKGAVAIVWEDDIYKDYFVEAPKVSAKNKANAGDALIGAYVWKLIHGADTQEALEWGVAAGAATVQMEGTSIASKHDTEKMVREIRKQHPRPHLLWRLFEKPLTVWQNGAHGRFSWLINLIAVVAFLNTAAWPVNFTTRPVKEPAKVVAEDYDIMSDLAFESWKETIVEAYTRKGHANAIMPTGSGPIGVYKRIVEAALKGDIDLTKVTIFMMDEYLHDDEYKSFINTHLLSKLPIHKWPKLNIMNGHAKDPFLEAMEYEKKIMDAGEIDVCMGGIGVEGHLAFNEALSSFFSRARVVPLVPSTMKANGNDKDRALSIGLGTVMRAKKVIIVANGRGKGPSKTDIIRNLFPEGETITPTTEYPASVLWYHANATFFMDRTVIDGKNPETPKRPAAMESAQMTTGADTGFVKAGEGIWDVLPSKRESGHFSPVIGLGVLFFLSPLIGLVPLALFSGLAAIANVIAHRDEIANWVRIVVTKFVPRKEIQEIIETADAIDQTILTGEQARKLSLVLANAPQGSVGLTDLRAGTIEAAQRYGVNSFADLPKRVRKQLAGWIAALMLFGQAAGAVENAGSVYAPALNGSENHPALLIAYTDAEVNALVRSIEGKNSAANLVVAVDGPSQEQQNRLGDALNRKGGIMMLVSAEHRKNRYGQIDGQKILREARAKLLATSSLAGLLEGVLRQGNDATPITLATTRPNDVLTTGLTIARVIMTLLGTVYVLEGKAVQDTIQAVAVIGTQA